MSPLVAAQIRENLDRIRERVARACARAGRDPAAVRLVAVSKKQPLEAMLAAIDAGHLLFGENYVQEGSGKAAALAARGLAAEIRLIGPLQRNKARDAVRHFAAVETLDSPELAARLQGQCERFGKSLEALLEINYEEVQKAGLDRAGAEALLRRAAEFPALRFAGLMCIPPVRRDERESRADFARLRETLASLREAVPPAPNLDLSALSMGMSHDFELAIECGATEVRVGTAIFGARRDTA